MNDAHRFGHEVSRGCELSCCPFGAHGYGAILEYLSINDDKSSVETVPEMPFTAKASKEAIQSDGFVFETVLMKAVAEGVRNVSVTATLRVEPVVAINRNSIL